MRIIGGKWRSRRLIRPANNTTRPFPDRVRQAVFDVLGSHYDVPGSLPELHVADVFAGSGSMGLEALSRGAASCCFFERDRAALRALQQNLDALNVGPEGRVLAQDAWQTAFSRPDGGLFDLVFLDPPYSDSDDTSGDGPVRKYLDRLMRNETSPLVVVHHRARVCYAPEDLMPWKIVKQRTFGSNAVIYLTI